jgi:hypothetical protein
MTPLIIPELTGLSDPLARRVWAKVAPGGLPGPQHLVYLGDCWHWTAALTSGGYGKIKIGGRWERAHRVVWALEYGPIPAGLVLDHLCHDPAVCLDWRACPHRRCVRPSHLSLVTVPVNSMRTASPIPAQARQTHCRRAGHPLSGDNLYLRVHPVTGKRYRVCRACARTRWNAWNGRLAAGERAREARPQRLAQSS